MSLRRHAIWVTLGWFMGSCTASDGDWVEESALPLVELAVPGDYATIQSAVNAASSGDVVLVAAGDYTENVRLKSGVRLIGAGPDRTVLRGQILFNLSENIEIAGFHIRADGASGLSIQAGIGCEAGSGDIHDNIVEGFETGIALAIVSELRVENNIVRLNQVGIETSELDSTLVINNQILHNRRSGIVLYFDARPDIVHNTIVGNGFTQSLNDGGSGIVVGPFNITNIQNNIIVGNNGGIFAYESSSRHHHNLVWGNMADYVSAASAGSGDLSLDPRFMDSGNKDYRLQSDSPAIDAGVVWSIATDFSGNLRPTGAAPDLGAFEHQSVADEGDLVINEVMANPLNEYTGEYVELFNPTDGPVDAAGLILDDGDATDDLLAGGSGTVVPAGGYAIVLDTGYVDGTYDIPAEAIRLTVPNASLGSGLSTNDPVRILRGDAVVSSYLHSFDPGNGLAVERIDPDGPDQADNWVTSPCGSSPGRPNCISFGGGPVGLPTLVISEVMANPANQTIGEYVEVFNFGDEAVELSGLGLTDGDSTDVIVSVAGKESLLPPGEHGIIIDSSYIPDMEGPPYTLDGEVPVVVTAGAALGNGLSSDDPIAILDDDGVTTVATYSHPITTSQQSVERVDPLESDLSANWIPSPCAERHSAGRPNCSYGGGGPVEVPNLVINEVMANPVDEDRDEFVEIHNPSNAPVDVAGMVLSDGDSTDVIGPFAGAGGSTTIPAGGYGLILDPEYLGEYAISDEAILLAPDDTTLGNGLATTDPITLYATDGLTVVASFSFPFNPGNGISVEKKGDTGDIESNWLTSSCSSGSSPGSVNCVDDAEPEPDPDPLAQLVISEVMANPLDESKGEFIEIVNNASSVANVLDFILSDGDATDTLEAYAGGTTEIPANGGIAVVLDRNYADFETAPYVIPGTAVLLTTDDNTIGSGLATDDVITLLAADGTTTLATYAFPFNPGNGFSAERVDLAEADTADNWVVSPCASGSSPGAVNCSNETPSTSVIDVNTATQADLEQIGGIGPATAGAIVAYRDSHGLYESLLQLTVNDGISADKVADWMVVEEGEPDFVIGLADAREVQTFSGVGELLAALPDPTSPGSWNGVPVRIQRAVALDTTDSETRQDFTFADWGDEAAFEPGGGDPIAVILDMAPGEASYARDQTNHANAMADWAKEDGDPYLNPLFYRWSEPLWSYGVIAYGHVYTLEGVIEVDNDAWRLRIRGETDEGIDRVVLIERWLAADQWEALEVVWTYGYKPVVVEATSGFSYSLPYRLALAHPARQYWYDENGTWIAVPRCASFGECGPAAADWNLFNEAIAAWAGGGGVGDGYCFEYDSVAYCFTTEEEVTGIDILNNATFSQLVDHCYTSSLANVVVSNRPFSSIANYDATSGVGAKSLWNLLICYVQSDDWPPADEGTVAHVLQGIPENEYTTVTVDDADVSYRHATLNIFEICDPPSTDHCIKVYSTSALPGALSVDDEVQVRGEVRYYDPGSYWELMLSDGEHFVTILTDR